MAIFPSVPEDVLNAANLIKALKEKQVLTRAEKDKINQARLKVAYWALGTERVVASRENLTFVLGPDSAEIMANYDRALEMERDKADERREDGRTRRKGGNFWGDA